MQGNSILPQQREDVILVQTTKDLKGSITGHTIPTGTLGKIISYDNGIFLVDFNGFSLYRVPAGSDLIREVRA